MLMQVATRVYVCECECIKMELTHPASCIKTDNKFSWYRDRNSIRCHCHRHTHTHAQQRRLCWLTCEKFKFPAAPMTVRRQRSNKTVRTMHNKRLHLSEICIITRAEGWNNKRKKVQCATKATVEMQNCNNNVQTPDKNLKMLNCIKIALFWVWKSFSEMYAWCTCQLPSHSLNLHDSLFFVASSLAHLHGCWNAVVVYLLS